MPNLPISKSFGGAAASRGLRIAATLEGRLSAKIDRVSPRLGKFEDSEVDKRLQLDVRVARIEKHLGLPKALTVLDFISSAQLS
jgi:hypothetical protein